jgi:hypothetical protein
MSEGKGKLAGREKAAKHKLDSNVMGVFAEGQLFLHNGKHSARYVTSGGKLACSKCKQILE